MASFKNLAHAYFAQETSRKVSMAKRELQKHGKFVGSKTLFGYQRDPNDKHKLIIKEDEAETVREIFQRVADGEFVSKITKDLQKRGKIGSSWTYSRVYTMLKKENYKGVLVQHMSEKALYKNEKFHIIPKSEQIRFEGAIPAIVSPELWEKANSVIAERNEKRHEGVPENPYKNLVFCGHCGKKVTCSFTRKYGKFSFICERCRGTFVPRKILDRKLFEHLKIPENTEITSDFLNKKIERITVSRDGFQELLTKVRMREIDVVIVKDLSRLGRNYIDVCKLTDSIFCSSKCDL